MVLVRQSPLMLRVVAFAKVCWSILFFCAVMWSCRSAAHGTLKMAADGLRFLVPSELWPGFPVCSWCGFFLLKQYFSISTKIAAVSTTSDCVKPREYLQQAEQADLQALQYTDIAQKNCPYFLSPRAIILGLSPREGQS